MITKIKHLIKKHVPSVLLLKTMAIFRFLLGNYINISESKPICYLMKLYCICFCSTVINNYYNEIFKRQLFEIYILSITEYVFTVMIYLIYGDDPILQFLSAIKTNDRIIGFKNFSFISNYVYLIIICNFVIRIAVSIIHAFNSLGSYSGYFSILFAVVSTDFNYFIIIIIFSIIQSRVKRLRIFLESNLVPINIVERNEVAISTYNVRRSLYNYNNLLDNLQRLDKQLQCLLTVNWASLSIRMILMSYMIISRFIFKARYSVIISFIVELMQSIVLVFTPAVIVEATTHEVDQIKKTLISQLMRSSDESLRFELHVALQYVSLRPFRYMICRAVPLNVNLPFTIIGLCITYVIVAFQLSHFIV